MDGFGRGRGRGGGGGGVWDQPLPGGRGGGRGGGGRGEWASWCCRQPCWVAGAARGWCRPPQLWIPHKEPAGQPPSWAELHPLLWEGSEGMGVSRTWAEDVELCRVPC